MSTETQQKQTQCHTEELQLPLDHCHCLPRDMVVAFLQPQGPVFICVHGGHLRHSPGCIYTEYASLASQWKQPTPMTANAIIKYTIHLNTASFLCSSSSSLRRRNKASSLHCEREISKQVEAELSKTDERNCQVLQNYCTILLMSAMQSVNVSMQQERQNTHKVKTNPYVPARQGCDKTTQGHTITLAQQYVIWLLLICECLE